MLVEKKVYSEDDVVTFKIVNGDELVARIVRDEDDAFVVSKPMTVIPSQQGVGLMPTLITSRQASAVRLDKRHVMLNNYTEDRMLEHYLELTTGIQTVRKGSIIV